MGADDKYLVNRTTVGRTRADAAERASKAWRLRVAGGTWADIAKALDMKGGAPAAYRAVKRYFGETPRPDREMLRELARARGEALWLRAFAEVERSSGAPAAVRAAVAVLDRMSRLDGLDEPARLQITPTDGDIAVLVQAAAKGLGLTMTDEADIWDAEYVDEVTDDD